MRLGVKQKIIHRWLAVLVLSPALFLPALSAHGQSMVRSQDYLRDLVRLSEIMGQVHAIRTICRGSGSQEWRQQMQGLLDLEAPTQSGVRRSMVNGFNAGYAAGSGAHTVCDNRAMSDYRALAERGRALSDQLTQAAIEDGFMQ